MVSRVVIGGAVPHGLGVRALSLGALLASVCSSVAIAQRSQHASDSTTRSNTPPAAPFLSKRDLVMFAGATLATVVVAPFDHDIQRNVQSADLRDNRGLHHAANAFAFTGGPGPFVAGGALYLAGRTAGDENIARLGVTLTEGVVIAAALNGVIKGVAGRALPNAKTTEPGDFSFGRGFHDGNGPFVSFPSGHTAASFAAAAVLSAEAPSWGSCAGRIVPPVAYTTATLVAVSRVYANVHWASDLPLGAAIGVWSGRTVAGWERRHPDNWLTRRVLGIGVVPDRHRLTVTAAMPFGLR